MFHNRNEEKQRKKKFYDNCIKSFRFMLMYVYVKLICSVCTIHQY